MFCFNGNVTWLHDTDVKATRDPAVFVTLHPLDVQVIVPEALVVPVADATTVVPLMNWRITWLTCIFLAAEQTIWAVDGHEPLWILLRTAHSSKDAPGVPVGAVIRVGFDVDNAVQQTKSFCMKAYFI